MLENYGYYTIQSAAEAEPSGGHLHVPDAAMTESAITVWDKAERDVSFIDHFEFMVIAVDDAQGDPADDSPRAQGRSYFIANRRSGLCLAVRSLEDAPLEQISWPPRLDDGTVNQAMVQFVLEPTDTGYYRIMSQFSGSYLAVEGTMNGDAVRTRNPSSTSGSSVARDTEFAFTETGPAPPSEHLVPEPDLSNQRKVPRMESVSTGLPDVTDPLLMDFDRLPFFSVNDPLLPSHRQVEMSPYYTLRRYRLWQKMSDRELDGLVERASTETTRRGMSQTDVKSVKTAFSASIETTVSASYSGFGAKAGVSVTARLQADTERSAESTTETSHERVTEDTVTYPAVGFPYRIARWRPIDRFELHRTNDALLNRWDVVRDDEEVIDTYAEDDDHPRKRRNQYPNRPG